MDKLANRVRLAPTTAVEGVWYRHVPARYQSSALDGRRATSRWGRANGFAVLYLGRPVDSVVVEAYRHLIDPVDDPAVVDHLAPRALVTCEVAVTDVLDLRTPAGRMTTELALSVLQSPTDDTKAYERCQEVAAVAHQLGLHGVIAPAATGLGETLALFIERLPVAQRPKLISVEAWARLPADPRSPATPRLRIVRE